jgi:hypothetical protein
VKRLPLILLLLGVVLGLSAQLPSQALAASAREMVHAGSAQNGMASMHGCKESMPKKAASTPCKCDLAGCIAMTASGMAMLHPDISSFAAASISSRLVRPTASVLALRGRSPAPDPEPPSA